MLAAFASEQMSLRRHVETIVKQWLSANCPWAFSNRALLLGAYDDANRQTQWDFSEILRSLLGGTWDPPMHPWESRRERLPDQFGKAQPFTMTPALQIDRTNARLLVEALSGRWGYDQERRDRRNLWYYVAAAFSLSVDRIDPGAPKLNDKDQGKTLSQFDARFV